MGTPPHLTNRKTRSWNLIIFYIMLFIVVIIDALKHVRCWPNPAGVYSSPKRSIAYISIHQKMFSVLQDHAANQRERIFEGQEKKMFKNYCGDAHFIYIVQ
jgi:uncharacterized ion transporter superfamily protein YfcC